MPVQRSWHRRSSPSRARQRPPTPPARAHSLPNAARAPTAPDRAPAGPAQAQLAPPNHRVQTGHSLDPQERRRHQLKSPETLEANRIRGGGNRDASVDDELQRPSRDNATAATEFGAGGPSYSFCHSGGRGSIGYISSRASSTAPGSIRCCPPTVSACSLPSRIHRRTVPGLRPARCAALATVSASRSIAPRPDETISSSLPGASHLSTGAKNLGDVYEKLVEIVGAMDATAPYAAHPEQQTRGSSTAGSGCAIDRRWIACLRSRHAPHRYQPSCASTWPGTALALAD